jgi:hypothetical protein
MRKFNILTGKFFSPVISQALPIKVNVCADNAAKEEAIRIAGIHPTLDDAFPAAKVNKPAPATLFTKLKTDAGIVDAPPPRTGTFWSRGVVGRAVTAPPERGGTPQYPT